MAMIESHLKVLNRNAIRIRCFNCFITTSCCSMMNIKNKKKSLYQHKERDFLGFEQVKKLETITSARVLRENRYTLFFSKILL